jgi:hypothetical protein
MQGIEIPIGAPLGQLDKDLKGAKNKLNQFAADAAKASSVLGGSVSGGAKSAGFALQNLGRVAQDAPFGFIGIQNNITPLLESFQRLKAESGSTGGALKALGQSLVGGGGLLLAVSLVTSALTVLAQNPDKVAGALNYLSGVVDNATESQKKYNEEVISNVATAKLEITNLENLISIAKDETLSRNARLEALKKVKAEYPEQLEFLRLENIGSKQAADAINLLSDSLIRKAKIQAAEKLLGDAFVKQLEATTKSAVQQASTFSKVVGAALGSVGIKNFVVLQNGIENQSKAFKEAGSDINTYSAILKKLNTEEAKVGTLFEDSVKKVKKQDFFRAPQFVAEPSQNELDKFVQAYRKTEAQLNKTPLVPFPGLKEKLEQVNLLLIEFNNSAKNIITNSIQSTFAQLGTAIGESLVNGGNVLKAVGETILQGLSNFLSEMGNALIKYGTLAVLKGKLDIAILTGGPVAIAAGLAAIGAGVALKAAAGALGAVANKNKNNNSVPTPQASSTISTSAAGSAQDFGGGRVVFEISGTNLVGVLNRAGAKLQRFG